MQSSDTGCMNGPGKPRTLTSQVSGADRSRDGANIGIWNIVMFNIYGIEIFLRNLKKNEMDKNQTFLSFGRKLSML